MRRRNFQFLTYIFPLTLVVSVWSIGRCNAQSERTFEEATCTSNLRKISEDSNNTLEDPHCDCGSMVLGIVQKIPYVRSSLVNAEEPLDVQFSSACVRCGMCLAVADELHRNLVAVHEMMLPYKQLNDTEIILLLRTICEQSFHQFNIQEIDGKRYISGPIPGARVVATSGDAFWEKNLRDTCHEYMDSIGELQLYKHWQDWFNGGDRIPDLSTILCRNELGVLRDCRSIEDTPKYEEPLDIYASNMKITAEFDC